MPVFKSTLAKRRRFQPPITTFFSTSSEASSSTTYATSHNHYSAATCSPHPVLPDKVQSSLLSVGMRVRKAMAEGYKTQMALEEEKALASKVAPQTAVSQAYPSSNTHAELAPFAGATGSSNNLVTDDGDAFSLPPSSQESVNSSVSFPGAMNGQKRPFDDDIFVDEDVDLDDADNDTWREAPVGRPILAPSLGSQRRRVPPPQKTSSVDTPMAFDDFEEATFLRRREEVDADYVRMDCA